ncbi:hypothetical protein BJY52DRAFT_1126563 [Lactarius psammicola]|nr:hypothetical protein BJY52DRAFT_1126563 [Lactarius psammicola]
MFTPAPPSTYAEVVCDVSKASADLDPPTIGQLDLSQKQRLGSGEHSYVFLASLTLPFCAEPSLRGEVAVKCAKVPLDDRKMLENEAEIYDKFPSELQESTHSSPPIVPKFFGYYKPSCESVGSYKGDDGDEEGARTVRRDVCKLLQSFVSPILLLEPCGEPVNAEMLSSDGDTISGIFERLHNARFAQKSTYPRNIVVQPGPLTHPRAERSFNDPSYRLIDFGRGVYYNGDESESADESLKEEKWRVRRLVRYGY